MKFKDLNTGEIWTLTEIREAYEQFADEMPYDSFEQYFAEMISLGRHRIGGFREVDE